MRCFFNAEKGEMKDYLKDTNKSVMPYLRKAVPSDVDLLYEWANEPEVRKNSFCSNRIDYREHVEWFDRMMSDTNVAQYIMMLDQTPIGQIRLALAGDTAEISYSISPKERKKGYGELIIGLSMDKVIEDYPHIKRVTGKVKPQNDASIKCFLQNGFRENYCFFEHELTNR